MVAYGGEVLARLMLDVSGFSRGVQQALAQISMLQRQAGTMMGRYASQYNNATSRINASNSAMEKSMRNVTEQTKGFTNLSNSLSNVSRSAREAAASYSSAGGGYAPVTQGITQTGKAAEATQSRISQMGYGLNSFFGSFVSFDLWMAAMVGNMLGKWTIGNAMAMEEAESSLKFCGMAADEAAKLNAKATEYALNASKISMNEMQMANSRIFSSHKTNVETLIAHQNTIGDFMAKYKSEGRTAEEAVLAINDGLDGQGRRLQELGIQLSDLKEAGWSGDNADVEGYLTALDKVFQMRGWSGWASKMNSTQDMWDMLNEKITLAGTLIGQQVLPALNLVMGGLLKLISISPMAVGGLLAFGGALVVFGLIYPILDNIAKGFGKAKDYAGKFKDSLIGVADEAGNVKKAMGGVSCDPCAASGGVDIGGKKKGQRSGGVLSSITDNLDFLIRGNKKYNNPATGAKWKTASILDDIAPSVNKGAGAFSRLKTVAGGALSALTGFIGVSPMMLGIGAAAVGAGVGLYFAGQQLGWFSSAAARSQTALDNYTTSVANLKNYNEDLRGSVEVLQKKLDSGTLSTQEAASVTAELAAKRAELAKSTESLAWAEGKLEAARGQQDRLQKQQDELKGKYDLLTPKWQEQLATKQLENKQISPDQYNAVMTGAGGVTLAQQEWGSQLAYLNNRIREMGGSINWMLQSPSHQEFLRTPGGKQMADSYVNNMAHLADATYRAATTEGFDKVWANMETGWYGMLTKFDETRMISESGKAGDWLTSLLTGKPSPDGTSPTTTVNNENKTDVHVDPDKRSLIDILFGENFGKGVSDQWKPVGDAINSITAKPGAPAGQGFNTWFADQLAGLGKTDWSKLITGNVLRSFSNLGQFGSDLWTGNTGFDKWVGSAGSWLQSQFSSWGSGMQGRIDTQTQESNLNPNIAGFNKWVSDGLTWIQTGASQALSGPGVAYASDGSQQGGKKGLPGLIDYLTTGKFIPDLKNIPQTITQKLEETLHVKMEMPTVQEILQSITDGLGITHGQPFKFPTANQVLKYIMDKLGITKVKSFKFPTANQILDWIMKKLGIKPFKLPTPQQIIGEIAKKIQWLIWQIPSPTAIVQKIGEFIQWLLWQIPGAQELVAEAGKFIDQLHWSIPSAGEILDAVVRVMTGGGAGGPGGPGGPYGFSPNISRFSTASGEGWGLGPLKYENYLGHKKDPMTALMEGGNCVDMSLGLAILAGLNGQKVGIGSGTWNGNNHVWAMINGKAYDPARFALEGNWNPPARGPGDSTDTENVVTKENVDIGDASAITTTMSSADSAVKNGTRSISGRLRGLSNESRSEWNKVAEATIKPVSRIINILQRLYQATGGQLSGSAGKGVAGGLSEGSMKALSSSGSAGGLFKGAPNWINTILSNANKGATNILGFDLGGITDWSNPAGIFKAFATALFRTFHYQFYFDDKKSNQETLADRAGNCYDTTQLLMSLASAFGLNSSMVHGTWDGVGHVWANIQGLGNMDSTAMMVRGNWNPPSAGPGVMEAQGTTKNKVNVNIIMPGEVYGMDDFDRKVSKSTDKAVEKIYRMLNR
jgi:hypothetical protein